MMFPPKMPELQGYHVDELLIDNEQPKSDPPRLPIPPSVNPLLKVVTLSSCMVDIARQELRECARLDAGTLRSYPVHGAGFALWCLRESARRLHLQVPVKVKEGAFVSAQVLYDGLLESGAMPVGLPEVGDLAFWAFSGVAGIVVEVINDRFKSIEINGDVAYDRVVIIAHGVMEPGLLGFIRLPPSGR